MQSKMMLLKSLNIDDIYVIDNKGLVEKIDCNTKIKKNEDKIPNLATTTTALNARINERKSEIPSITG